MINNKYNIKVLQKFQYFFSFKADIEGVECFIFIFLLVFLYQLTNRLILKA